MNGGKKGDFKSMPQEKIINFPEKKTILSTKFYCCEQFLFHLNKKEKIIVYESCFRRYLLRSDYWQMNTIYFCPWCGKKLPENLANKFFEVIKEELETFVAADEIHKLPKEFKTDEWWKKRGL